jgi:nucleoside-diphosphate-sugar epimerase
MVSINELADIIGEIAQYPVEKIHIDGPMGVRGRNSDNNLLRKTLKWEPSISLEEGLSKTYSWIEKNVQEMLKGAESDQRIIQALKTSKIFSPQCSCDS